MNLVYLDGKKQPYTTSEIVAECAEVQHETIQRLIRKHLNEFEEFSKVRFEIRPLPSGQKAKIYHLNEQQATLLITFLKNTAPVVEFKKNLVKAFFKMREDLARYRQQYEASKPTQKALSKAIAEHPRYKGSARVGMNIATMNSNIIKIVTGDRRMKKAELNADELEEFEILEHLAIYYLKRGHSISEVTKRIKQKIIREEKR